MAVERRPRKGERADGLRDVRLRRNGEVVLIHRIKSCAVGMKRVVTVGLCNGRVPLGVWKELRVVIGWRICFVCAICSDADQTNRHMHRCIR